MTGTGPRAAQLSEDPSKALGSVLIANRGEIAVRVVRAAHDAGMRAVAVHTSYDRHSVHVRIADEAVEVESYLDSDGLVAAALGSVADAVHPGYGFLAEDDGFAQAVLDAGLIWVGPPPAVIRELGDKVAARRLAHAVGAPLAPGTEDAVSGADEVVDFARRHGLPVVIKAAHGGGGRGLKVVRTADEIPQAFASATREASAAFGRGTCFVERFLDRARHVEAQVLADAHGGVVVVGTRDCSLQRRNQKLVEEGPAPFLSEQQRRAVHDSARDLCRAAGYVGAGTVEYLLGEDGTMSFLEVNTRLQVEHAVTEESTGVDLVAEQFRIAAGAKLVCDGDPPEVRHAIEFRLVSEDAGRDFLPVPGTITEFDMPSGPGVRVDAGVEAGSVIDERYDSMFAKLIVVGADRAEALRRARRALAEVRIEGVPTPVPFYRLVVDHPDFLGDGKGFGVHNRWVDTGAAGPVEPWAMPDADLAPDELIVRVGRRALSVRVPGLGALGSRAAGIREASAALRDPEAVGVSGSEVTAPMQGTIVTVAVADGDLVEQGALVAVLEAMKMENRILAHKGGRISALAVTPGDTVAYRAPICEIEADGP